MNITSKRALAISRDEFSRMFRKCAPPPGWPEKIGVANSGGPDSTCLLYLIHRYLSDTTNTSSQNIPQGVTSLTINHNLQASSRSMAEHCAKISQSMGLEHYTYEIPWSSHPYPPRPCPGEMFENTARTARYHSLFEIMRKAKTPVLAFGHHSDDQIETSLMRLGRGTTEIGAGGMRPCRRWGMGMGKGEGSLGWAGYEGMKKWIVRPLLDVSKDRILATCEANNLEYITDSTNFQPHATLRNAIRHSIAKKESLLSQTQSIPSDIAEKLTAIDHALESTSVDLSSGPEQLRAVVSMFTAQVEDIDMHVDNNLKRSTVPSPPGTHLISLTGISRIQDETIRRAMVLRIMRHVSFHPWGSLRADANRRMASISQITDKIWDPDPFEHKIRMFVAGGGVLWTPVVFNGDRISTPDRVFATNMKSEGNYGWLASRQPPLSRSKLTERGLPNPLEADITDALVNALEVWNNGGPSVLTVLYDCRFLLNFSLEKMPQDLRARFLIPNTRDRIRIYPNTRWYWPKVVREWYGITDVLQSEINQKPVALLLRKAQTDEADHTVHWKPREKGISSEWIDIEWIRSVGAL